MNYIVDPRVFYWMSVIDNLKTICVVLFSLSIVAFGLCFIFYFNDWDEELQSKCKKGWITFLILIVFFGLGIIFIPSKTTMTEMLIAKYATTENAELGIDAIKSIVDYIVSAMQAVK